MSRVPPLPESEATDKAAQTYGRIKDMLGAEAVPPVFLAMGRVPAYLSDFYMNYKKFVHGDGVIPAKSRIAIAIAVALKEGATEWVDYFLSLPAASELGDDAVAEINAIVATNVTYNTFFKFRRLSGSDLFEGMPVGLRAHTFHSVSFDDTLVELLSTAISNLNSCEPCVSGHVKKARSLGISDEALLETIQCAAVVYSGIQFCRGANC